ncbi:MAG: hypothetical protein HYU77_13855 [Betaproteobacteria bacterium]|nr:hypothetical protein [Betaproteobacteria bacterium]
MAKLKIKAQKDGFRRAGRAWSAAGEVVDSKDFTPQQIAALGAEPMLEVSEVEPAEDAKAKKK